MPNSEAIAGSLAGPGERIAPVVPAGVALCVDLDGTLLNGDVFWESLLVLVRREPGTIVRAPWWILRGRAHAKRQVALRAPLDPATLPYRPEVLALIEESRASGRPVALATAADEAYASSIAAHLGGFAAVMASDGVENLSGPRKADCLCERFGAGQFDYVGNDWVDIPSWRVARHATVVAAPRRLLRHLTSRPGSVRELVPARRVLRPALRALRFYQWVKNLLVFIPLIASHRLLEPELLARATMTFLAFSLCASAIYVLNDLLDIQTDRLHPRKRLRPFASGELPIPAGLAMSTALLAAALLIAARALSPALTVLLLFYAAMSLLYSLWIKRQPVLDVFVLAGFYVLRIFAGGVATGIELSTWLLAFGTFFFLNLAFVKRYTELQVTGAPAGVLPGRSYRQSDGPWLLIVGLSAGFMAVLVLALYAAEPDVSAAYRRPAALMLLCPLLLFWVTRTWFTATRGNMDDDPVLAAVHDPISHVVMAAGALILLAAR